MGSSVRPLFVQLPIDSTINATSRCNMQTVNWVCTEKEGLESRMHAYFNSLPIMDCQIKQGTSTSELKRFIVVLRSRSGKVLL